MQRIGRWLAGAGTLVSKALLAGLTIAPATAEDFTVVALPDTQNYSQSYPQIYTAQTQWIVANEASRDIRFVTHLGDLVNQAQTLSQWANASAAMALLDAADIPNGTATGNHDFLYPGDYYDPSGTNYLNNFGVSRYTGRPWYRGVSPSGLSNYQIISAAGREWLFLHLALETPAAELAWAQGILNQNQDKPTWVSTHRYLYDWTLEGAFPFIGAGRYDDFNYFFEPLYRHDGIKSDVFFDSFVAANRQIYLVMCGHNHAEYRQTSTNNFGLTVHEILADYQDEPNGGDGWLRICRMRPGSDRIEVQSYSPTRNEFWTDGDSQFTLTVDFDAYPLAEGDRVLGFQQGVDGYTGTRDTWVGSAIANSSRANAATLWVDDDTENSFFGEDPGQALLRFEDIFQPPVQEGDPLPDRIPTDATINDADLIITLADDEDLGNTTVRVYRMTRSWNDGSTWNSLGGGINVGSETSGQIASFTAENEPDFDFGRTLNVTGSVRAWQSGTSNLGFAIIRDQTDFNDDGIEIHSAEAGSATDRPKLSVSFSYPVANVLPNVTQPLTTATPTVVEGSEVIVQFAASDPNPLDPLVFRLEGQDIGFATGSGGVEHPMLMEDEGSYPFSASVADDTGAVAAGQLTLTVTNGDPQIVELSGDRTVDIGRAFVILVEAVDPGPLDVLQYTWSAPALSAAPLSTAAFDAISVDMPGAFTVTLTVSDGDGGMTTDTFDLTVLDLPADGDFDSNGLGIENGAFVEASDAALFDACRAGPGAPPAPGAPWTGNHCLSAFDADTDGDVDETDRALLLTGAPPPPAARQLVAPYWALLLLAGLLVLIRRRLQTPPR